MAKKNPLKFKDEHELVQFIREHATETTSEKGDWYDVWVTTTVKLFGHAIFEKTTSRSHWE